jgi:hypothetical protein
MKAICFKCHFVGIGVAEPTCPACGFPLIVNTEPVALGAKDLEVLFNRSAEAPPLPGVNPEPRKAVLLAARRRERAQAILEAQRRSAIRRRRAWIVGEIAAASALVAGALMMLHQLGAL